MPWATPGASLYRPAYGQTSLRQNRLLGFKPEAVIGDKGFDSDGLIAYIEALEAEAVIPSKNNRIIQREIDTNLYADRNKIEWFFSRIKHYRRIATRYEKTARNYRAFLHVASIVTLLLRLSTHSNIPEHMRTQRIHTMLSLHSYLRG